MNGSLHLQRLTGWEPLYILLQRNGTQSTVVILPDAALIVPGADKISLHNLLTINSCHWLKGLSHQALLTLPPFQVQTLHTDLLDSNISSEPFSTFISVIVLPVHTATMPQLPWHSCTDTKPFSHVHFSYSTQTPSPRCIYWQGLPKCLLMHWVNSYIETNTLTLDTISQSQSSNKP